MLFRSQSEDCFLQTVFLLLVAGQAGNEHGPEPGITEARAQGGSGACWSVKRGVHREVDDERPGLRVDVRFPAARVSGSEGM